MSIMCMPALVCLFRYTSCVYQRRRLARLKHSPKTRSPTSQSRDRLNQSDGAPTIRPVPRIRITPAGTLYTTFENFRDETQTPMSCTKVLDIYSKTFKSTQQSFLLMVVHV